MCPSALLVLGSCVACPHVQRVYPSPVYAGLEGLVWYSGWVLWFLLGMGLMLLAFLALVGLWHGKSRYFWVKLSFSLWSACLFLCHARETPGVHTGPGSGVSGFWECFPGGFFGVLGFKELERECNAQWCRVRELEHTVHALTNEWNEKKDATEAVQVLQEQLREEVAESRSELDQERQTRSVMLTSIYEGILELSSAADDRALHARQELRAEQDRIQYHESHAVYARQTLDHERLEFRAQLAEDEVEIQSLLASTKLHTLEASESHAERSQRIREDAAQMRVDFMEDRAKTAREKRCLQEELHEMEQERRVVSNARNALAMAGPGGAPQSTELQFSLVLRQLEHRQGVVREGVGYCVALKSGDTRGTLKKEVFFVCFLEERKVKP